MKRMDEIKRAAKKEQAVKKEETLLTDFFSEVSSSTAPPKEAATPTAQPNSGTTAPTQDAPAGDDMLAGFFSDLAGASAATASAEAKKVNKDLSDKYLNQDLGDSKSQYERLVQPNYKW